MQAAAPRRPLVRRFAGVVLALAASAPFGFGLSSCAAEDFATPIPDDPITSQEFDQGATAVQQITLGGPDPAFDNAQTDEHTDGVTEGLAPNIIEPTAQETARDLATIDQPATSTATRSTPRGSTQRPKPKKSRRHPIRSTASSRRHPNCGSAAARRGT